MSYKILPRERCTASRRHTVTARPLSVPHAGSLLPTVCPILKQTITLYAVLSSEHHLSSGKRGGNRRFLF